ncbi:MAG TPA: DegT/DnrJ/EryC1/StrS family aminotransferase [Sphingobacteriaceae bacterium]
MTEQEIQEKIPCLDLGRQHQQIKKEVFEIFDKIYDQTAFSGGPVVEEFERNFAAFCGTRYAVGVNNGTSALHLALLALGIGAGDEVIVPANTFIATAWGVSYTGARPVFVDCRPDTWQIDAEQIRSAITSRTRAVIGVHLYGQPFDVEAVAGICRDHGLLLIEDAAQAQGARYRGRTVGGFGEMGCFSFYPGKNLGACGEAGGITTHNEQYSSHLQSLRNHGSATRYYHDQLGFNMRMGGLEAGSLLVKLKYLNEWNNSRKAIAARYRQEIRHELITLQIQPDWADSVHHLFVVTTPDRDALIAYLHEHRIFPGLHYPVPCHLQKAYRNLGYREGDCPNAEYLAAHCLSLPMYAELTAGQAGHVIETLNRYPGC